MVNSHRPCRPRSGSLLSQFPMQSSREIADFSSSLKAVTVIRGHRWYWREAQVK